MLATACDFFQGRLPNKPYCTDDLSSGLLVRPKSQAILRKYVQMNPPTSLQGFTIDIDRPLAVEAHEQALLPPPSILVINQLNGHGHAIYLLRTPVIRSACARDKPLRWISSIALGYRRRLGGDPGYSGLIVRNPLHPDHHVLDFGRLYELEELDRPLDLEDKRPTKKHEHEAGAGRNVHLFNSVRFWAYERVGEHESFQAWHSEVISKCRAVNAMFLPPLPESEVRATAKSITKWTWARRAELAGRKQVNRGRYGCSRKEAGRTTAELRRAQTSAKIEIAIRTLIARGKPLSPTQIAEMAGVSRPTVYRFLWEYNVTR